jgi:ribulose-5-phosphate 4-epimerase/fuculose-1-phosphate aldolase
VVSGATLEAAAYATEELDEPARLFLLLRGAAVNLLTPQQIEELKSAFELDF